jgi:hypothetical protein
MFYEYLKQGEHFSNRYGFEVERCHMLCCYDLPVLRKQDGIQWYRL